MILIMVQRLYYTGPYEVIERRQRTFFVKVGIREGLISIAQIKLTHVDTSIPVAVDVPPTGGRPPQQTNRNDFYDCIVYIFAISCV